jgi:hypothetical protein
MAGYEQTLPKAVDEARRHAILAKYDVNGEELGKEIYSGLKKEWQKEWRKIWRQSGSRRSNNPLGEGVSRLDARN